MCPTPLRPLFAHTGSHVARINSIDALTAAVADFSVTCIKLPCPPLISTDLPCPLQVHQVRAADLHSRVSVCTRAPHAHRHPHPAPRRLWAALGGLADGQRLGSTLVTLHAERVARHRPRSPSARPRGGGRAGHARRRRGIQTDSERGGLLRPQPHAEQRRGDRHSHHSGGQRWGAPPTPHVHMLCTCCAECGVCCVP